MPDCPTPAKRAYATAALAEVKLSQIWTALLQPRHPRKGTTPCRAYLCDPGCGLWHLTSHSLRPDQTQNPTRLENH